MTDPGPREQPSRLLSILSDDFSFGGVGVAGYLGEGDLEHDALTAVSDVGPSVKGRSVQTAS